MLKREKHLEDLYQNFKLYRYYYYVLIGSASLISSISHNTIDQLEGTFLSFIKTLPLGNWGKNSNVKAQSIPLHYWGNQKEIPQHFSPVIPTLPRRCVCVVWGVQWLQMIGALTRFLKLCTILVNA